MAATVVSGESWRPGGVRRKCCGEAVPGELSLSSPERPKIAPQTASSRPKSPHPAPNRLIPPQIVPICPEPSPRGNTRGRNNARGWFPWCQGLPAWFLLQPKPSSVRTVGCPRGRGSGTRGVRVQHRRSISARCWHRLPPHATTVEGSNISCW